MSTTPLNKDKRLSFLLTSQLPRKGSRYDAKDERQQERKRKQPWCVPGAVDRRDRVSVTAGMLQQVHQVVASDDTCRDNFIQQSHGCLPIFSCCCCFVRYALLVPTGSQEQPNAIERGVRVVYVDLEQLLCFQREESVQYFTVRTGSENAEDFLTEQEI